MELTIFDWIFDYIFESGLMNAAKIIIVIKFPKKGDMNLKSYTEVWSGPGIKLQFGGVLTSKIYEQDILSFVPLPKILRIIL